MGYEIGVDVGGTFTDLVCVADDGSITVGKVSSTKNQADAIVDGISSFGLDASQIEFLAHGTTVATNALIVKNGARTALITTRGFRDVLELRRTNKGDLYDLQWDPPPPLIRRANRLEITERIGWDGEILVPLVTEEVSGLCEILRKRGIESLAIVLLHSYVNDSHERLLAQLIREEMPELQISLSCEILPLYREFERTATVAANAYVSPVIRSYFELLRSRLDALCLNADVLVMQSNGGLSSIEAASQIPAKLVRSGPSAGAVALRDLSRQLDIPNIIGLDIGGTSADVALVVNGTPQLGDHLDVEFGLPVMFPSLDIISIGAGGGSIAAVDVGGSLSVGPRSAGSIPGPACYGKGGEFPTSTDAQLVLGRISSSDGLAGGGVKLDEQIALEAVRQHVAEPLGLSVDEAADGIVRVLTNNMMRAVRLVTIEKGYDPRDFVLCGFGGAGPMYAADIARDLAIPKVVIPLFPGVMCAHGLLSADVVYDSSRTLLVDAEAFDEKAAERVFDELENSVSGSLGKATGDVQIRRQLEVLFTGQIHALSIDVPDGPFTPAMREAVINAFHVEHNRIYGYAEVGDPITFVTARVFAVLSRSTRPRPPIQPQASEATQRNVYFSGHGWMDTPVMDRRSLHGGNRLVGPLIINQLDTTVVVPPECRIEVASSGDITMEVSL